MDTYKVILYLNNSLLFICAVIGLLKYRFLKNTEKWYVYYIIFLFFIEAAVKISLYVFKLGDVNFLFPGYVSGELLLLGSLFIKKADLSYFWYVPIVILTGYFFIETPMGNNDLKKVISNIVVICFAGYSLLTEIKSHKATDRFLLVDSFIFLYYTVSVFVFFLLRQLESFSKETMYTIWNINNILCCFLYLSIIYTFLKLKK